jgi:hypothetical protein
MSRLIAPESAISNQIGLALRYLIVERSSDLFSSIKCIDLQRQPMKENIMLIVSGEAYDRTAAESVRPSSERHNTGYSGEVLESVVG